MTKKEFIEKWTHEDFELYSTILDDLESISDLPEHITDEQFAKELERRWNKIVSPLWNKYKNDPISKRYADLVLKFMDAIKSELLKGGKP